LRSTQNLWVDRDRIVNNVPFVIELDDSDFEEGALRQKSNIRPTRIFTCDIRIILYRVGLLKLDKVNVVIEKVVEIFRS